LTATAIAAKRAGGVDGKRMVGARTVGQIGLST
jgi:hypothetical protein